MTGRKGTVASVTLIIALHLTALAHGNRLVSDRNQPGAVLRSGNISFPIRRKHPSMSIVVKLKTPNSASTPAFIDARPSWEDLVSEIDNIDKKNFVVTFIDEAKNSILLKNEDDLQRFYTEYPGDIEFFVHDLQAPGESAFN